MKNDKRSNSRNTYTRLTDLPCADGSCGNCKRPLVHATQLEGVGPHFDDVVEQGPECGHGVRGREQNDVTKLQKHFQIVVEGTLSQAEAYDDLGVSSSGKTTEQFIYTSEHKTSRIAAVTKLENGSNVSRHFNLVKMV